MNRCKHVDIDTESFCLKHQVPCPNGWSWGEILCDEYEEKEEPKCAEE